MRTFRFVPPLLLSAVLRTPLRVAHIVLCAVCHDENSCRPSLCLCECTGSRGFSCTILTESYRIYAFQVDVISAKIDTAIMAAGDRLPAVGGVVARRDVDYRRRRVPVSNARHCNIKTNSSRETTGGNFFFRAWRFVLHVETELGHEFKSSQAVALRRGRVFLLEVRLLHGVRELVIERSRSSHYCGRRRGECFFAVPRVLYK